MKAHLSTSIALHETRKTVKKGLNMELSFYPAHTLELPWMGKENGKSKCHSTSLMISLNSGWRQALKSLEAKTHRLSLKYRIQYQCSIHHGEKSILMFLRGVIVCSYEQVFFPLIFSRAFLCICSAIASSCKRGVLWCTVKDTRSANITMYTKDSND